MSRQALFPYLDTSRFICFKPLKNGPLIHLKSFDQININCFGELITWGWWTASVSLVSW